MGIGPIIQPSVDAVNQYGRPDLTTACWDDLSVSIASAPPGPANSPGFDPIFGTAIRAYHFSWNAGNPEELFFDTEALHDYKPGTDLLVHVHWTNPTAGAGGGVENVEWEMDYLIANTDAQFPAGAVTIDATVDIQNQPIREHNRTAIDTISGASLTEGAVLMGRIRRMTSIGNDHESDVVLIRLGFHYQVNAMGTHQSTPPYTK